MELFEKLMRLHLEYLEKKLIFEEQHRNVEAIIAITRERIATDKQETAEKIEQYKKTVADQSRPQTVRRIAEKELEALQNCTFSASDEEREAFETAFEAEKRALSDLGKAKTQVNEAFADVRRKLEEMQKESGYDQIFSSYTYWVDGNEKDFSWLCKEVEL